MARKRKRSISERVTEMATAGRVLGVGSVVLLIVLFFALGWHKYLSFEYLKEHQQQLHDYYLRHRLLTVVMYVAVMVVVAGFWGLGQVPLTILAGAIFGRFWGAVIANVSAAVGDVLAFLAVRYGLAPSLETRWKHWLVRLRRGTERDGAYYLFLLRVIPIMPAFVVNAGMGLTSISLSAFWWVTLLGTLPGKFLYANAGTELAQLDSWRGIMSPSMIATFAALGLLPLVTRKMIEWLRPQTFEKA